MESFWGVLGPYPTPEITEPNEAELESMLRDAAWDTDLGGFETSDGCMVEPDGNVLTWPPHLASTLRADLMEELRIVDYTEWWITHEDGYGNHSVWTKATDEQVARETLDRYRGTANKERKDRFECQEVTIHRTARKLDW
jgi:hypothetical protein